jgi:hypothetical protein
MRPSQRKQFPFGTTMNPGQNDLIYAHQDDPAGGAMLGIQSPQYHPRMARGAIAATAGTKILGPSAPLDDYSGSGQGRESMLIDPPSPFSPIAEWWAFLSRMQKLDQNDPQVQFAVRLAYETLEEHRGRDDLGPESASADNP